MAEDRARVLLVEDDEVLAAVVVQILSEQAETIWADSAEKGLELLPRGSWDLVIADIGLPGLDGIGFAGRVKAGHAHLSVLMMSGYTTFDDAVKAIRAGADDYLAKPVDPDALRAKVAELVARTHAERARTCEVVLAVGAHPDDVEIGVGGILLRHAAAGHEVAIMTVTGGEQGGEAEERASESRRAADLLGAQLFHTRLTDTSVSDGGDTVRTIERVVKEVGPTTVYTHTPRDVHQDHRAVHSATLVAVRGVSRVYCYQAPSTTVEFRPTRFIGIDDYLDQKLAAIEAYATQTAVRSYLDPELLRATARYWGRFASTRFVEPLEVIRETDLSSLAPALPGREPADV